MKKIFTLALALIISGATFAQTSTWVKAGADGKLTYTPDAKGNTIPDFSMVGYRNGNVAIPTVAVVKTISPVAGDNLAHIQAAINEVAARPFDANGFRGAILLKAGTYNVSNTINVRSGGIVIRGEGNGTTGTVIHATRAAQHTVLSISGSGSHTEVSGTRKRITTSYVPVGSKSFVVESVSGYAVGDKIIVRVEPKQAWIDMLGMAQYGWTTSGYRMSYLRTITRIEGNRVYIDIPVVDPIDVAYRDGYIYKYSWSKIENVGVENIRFTSAYNGTEDENHAWTGVSFNNMQHGWTRNCNFLYFGYSAVHVNGGAANVSVLNCSNTNPISQTTGGRKYSFNCDGQLNLFKDCYTNGGRHDYVTGATVEGPNAFVRCRAENQKSDIGPHHRWATGVLFDNIVGNGEMNVQNRENSGTGHGWAGAQCVFWNCTGSKFVNQRPPQHFNWAIGCKGNVTQAGTWNNGNPGIWESTGTFVTPSSLYEKQLQDRLSGNNQVPSVSVTSPSNNAVFTAPASIVINANATDDGSITKVEFFNGSTKLGEDVSAPYSFSWNNVAAGTYSITARATDNSGATSTSAAVAVTVNVPQGPYLGTPWTIPGKIEAENFDVGGQGVAYNDLTPGNSGTVYRTTEAVDIQASTDGGSGFNIGWIDAGEWLEYTVTITTAGAYKLEARVAAMGSGKSFHVEIDGQNISGSINVPVTGGWQNWQTVSVTTPSLTAGQKVMRVVMDGSSFNFNHLTFTPVVTNVNPEVSITSPDNNASFTAPATVAISANATDADGSITKVEFFNGSVKLGEDITSPYSLTWSNVGAGTYVLTARATDNQGAVATSSAVSVNVSSVPVCEPVSASSHDGNVPSNVLDGDLNTRWSASGDGQWIQFCLSAENTVNGVQIAFYNGNARVSTFDILTSLTGSSWSTAASGVKSSGTSLALETFNIASVQARYVRIVGHANSVNLWNSFTEVKILTGISTNTPPSVNLTSPLHNATFTAPATVSIAANATDDVAVSKVEFFNGSTKLGEDLSSPYSFSWTNVAAGTYAITAVATDNSGASTTSASVSVTVNVPQNQMPSVSISSPSNNAVYTAPATVTISANATDADGTISKVEFYNGTTKLGEDLTSPYSFSWSNVASGTYLLAARATDNAGGVTTSGVVSITVNPQSSCSAPQYIENGGYVAGSRVKNVGNQYQCKPYPYSGWCNGAAWAYAPGTGAYWQDAWTLVGPCAKMGVNETLGNNIEIYPNPTEKMSVLKILTSHENASYSVINALGVQVLKGTMSGNEAVIDLSGMENGVYMIRISEGDNVWVEKLIKN